MKANLQKRALLILVMDSLIAKADIVQPLAKRRKLQHKSSSQKAGRNDHPVASIAKHSALPKSLQLADPSPKDVHSYNHVANPKLRTHLQRESTNAARSKALVKDTDLLLTEDAGRMQVEGEMEKTWRVGQDEISKAAGQQAARGRQEWKLDGGPYRSTYTKNGR